MRLRCVHPEGGLIPQLDVIIQRVYPKLYMETIKGDNDEPVRITRSERDEELESKAYEVCFEFAEVWDLIIFRNEEKNL